jgi:hypothetical protein
MDKINLLDLSLDRLGEKIKEMGEPGFRATDIQVAQ